MKKTVLISTIALSSVVLAGPFISNGKEVLKEHPIKLEHRSSENGGTSYAIDTYKDGIGVVVGTFETDKAVNNQPMNTLVFKYGEKAKEIGSTLADQVLITESTTASEEDKKLANKLSALMAASKVDGSTCTDNDPATVNDRYSSGICIGSIPKNCMDLKQNGAPTGTYTVDYLGDGVGAPLTCDMNNAGGGWAIVTPRFLLENGLTVQEAKYTGDSFFDSNMFTRFKYVIDNQKIGIYKKLISKSDFLFKRPSSAYSRSEYVNLSETFDIPMNIKVRFSRFSWSGDADTARFYYAPYNAAGNNLGYAVDTGKVNWAASWQWSEYNKTLPVGTSKVRVYAQCNRVYGTDCNGEIDEVRYTINYDFPGYDTNILAKF
jgi:hypothetical protein